MNILVQCAEVQELILDPSDPEADGLEGQFTYAAWCLMLTHSHIIQQRMLTALAGLDQ